MSFSGAIASMIRFSSRWSGSGSWTRRPSIASSALTAAIVASRSSSDVSAGRLDVARLHARRGRGLLLQVDVDVRGGVVADEDVVEADMADLGDLGGDFLAHFRAERLAVDQGARARQSAYAQNAARWHGFPARTTPTRSPRAARRSASTARPTSRRATKAAESVTGLAVIPVSVAQLQVSLGEYALSDDGDVVETGRADEEVDGSARAYRGRPDRVGAARREGDRRVRRLPHIRRRRPHHARVVLRLQATPAMR